MDIAVCANSLRQRGLAQDQLQGGLEVVPSGVVELVKRQQAGFAYIKPWPLRLGKTRRLFLQFYKLQRGLLDIVYGSLLHDQLPHRIINKVLQQ